MWTAQAFVDYTRSRFIIAVYNDFFYVPIVLPMAEMRKVGIKLLYMLWAGPQSYSRQVAGIHNAHLTPLRGHSC